MAFENKNLDREEAVATGRTAVKNTARKQKQKRRNWKALLPFMVLWASVAVFVYLMVTASSVHEKAIELGFFNAPPEFEERHVWITQNCPGEGRYGDVPVHVLFRHEKDSAWELCGTGTRLGKNPGYILSAYHVFEGRPGQYGARRIGPKELKGSEKVVPIVSCQYMGNADDAVLCAIDENRQDVPTLNVPEAKSMFRNWEIKDYEAKTWPAKIHFSTYPDKVIQNIMYIEVRPGSFHYIFDWPVVPGESGTGAFVEGAKEDAYLVVIRGQAIPEMVFNQLTPEEKKRINWSPGKIYGVGVLVLLHPKGP